MKSSCEVFSNGIFLNRDFFSFDLREHICTDQFLIVEKFEISF